MSKPSYLTYGFGILLLALSLGVIVPMPPWVLDGLLALYIVGCGLVMLISVAVAEPLEFSAFAPALLVALFFRFLLEISATRLILLQGHTPGGVGHLIPAFGNVVVGGNLIVGLIIFAIFITVQFIVIASGSQRIAEVAARFTLDAMPGKQMAIDADVNAGLLDQEGARKKRNTVQKEADFYGAMDGAGKYVKNDAIAALIIVLCNLLGGLAVGMLYHGLSPQEALATYAILSIGNALATTLPSFMLCIAMGMMVTRVAADGSLGEDIAAQVMQRPDVMRSAAGLAFMLAIFPPMPHVAFGLLGVGLLVLASYAARTKNAKNQAAKATVESAERTQARRPETALGLVGVDAMSIEFGADLVGMLHAENGEALLDRVSEVRRAIAGETGIVIPGVRLKDDQMRDPGTYGIRVRDELAGSGVLRTKELLAVARADILATIDGEGSFDPVYGLPAKWIAVADREPAAARGALVFDPISIVGSHLAETARLRAAQLFGRQELQTLVEHLKKSVPVVCAEIGTEQLPFPTLHKVFTILLRERVWPRDPVVTLEAILEATASSRDPRDLADAARKVLVAPMLRRRNLTELYVLMFDPEFERRISAEWHGGDAPDPQLALYVRERIEAYARSMPAGRATVVCTSLFRRTLSELLARFNLTIDVFAFSELPGEINVKPLAIVGPPEPQAVAAGAA
ncbi:MAG: FHIPEP family type III secretion protein [Vulcanimicrobiaceae bacterium]